MGMQAICNDKLISCGSYSSVMNNHHYLLMALKDYLELEYSLEDKDTMVDILVEILSQKNNSYTELNFEKNKNAFRAADLDGLFPYLSIEEQGYMTSYECERFLITFDIISDYVHHSITTNEKFFLNDIFEESVESDENVDFC